MGNVQKEQGQSCRNVRINEEPTKLIQTRGYSIRGNFQQAPAKKQLVPVGRSMKPYKTFLICIQKNVSLDYSSQSR